MGKHKKNASESDDTSDHLRSYLRTRYTFMRKLPIFTFFIAAIICVCSCVGQTSKSGTIAPKPILAVKEVSVGAAQTAAYLPLLKGKRIGMVVNQTSMIAGQSIVDSLLHTGMDIKKIFSPEHGFRGKADAGAQVKDGKDIRTGLPIISLYGKNKKPTDAQFADLDVVIFDIQDVGARFYTYISTMHYVMQTAAEVNIPVIVLDRPNPNGHYVDGPVLEKAFSSFVGMHQVPIVHGMTIGEYAKMINGEAWLGEGLSCDLTVIQCKNYDRNTPYILPVKPSPNLPNNLSIYLYPSLCLFEGTDVSVGRGTNKQFQIIGHPKSKIGDDFFTPRSRPGATQPKHKGVQCRGVDFSKMSSLMAYQQEKLNLQYLIDFYQDADNKDDFFNSFFEKLAGTDKLQKMIQEGKNEAQIRATWQSDLEAFKQIRKKYLIYN